MRNLFGYQGEAGDFDSTFSASIGRTLVIPPGQGGFQNLLALNIHRGRDHGLASYSRYRSLCRVPSEAPSGSNPFSIYRRQIRNPTTLDRLRRAYGSPKYHVDLLVAGIAESNNNNQLLGPTFQCIIKRSLQNVRDGDRFFLRNTGVFSRAQIHETAKMILAKVLCLTLKDTPRIQRNLFNEFDPTKQQRVSCQHLRVESLDVETWLAESRERL